MFGERRKKREVMTHSVFTAPHGCQGANLLRCTLYTLSEYISSHLGAIGCSRKCESGEREHEIRKVRRSERKCPLSPLLWRK